MSPRALVVSLPVAALLAASLLAQTPATPQISPGQPAPGQPSPPQMPPRAGRAVDDPQKGTSIMRGYVVAADSGAPVRRAMVRAVSQDGRNSGMTTTDADGRFEIKELPGGRYSITVSKAGFVSMQYGQRRPDQLGAPLEILDGQLVDKIGFSLPRGGVITGRVLDEFGEPIAGAQISALRLRFVQGTRRLMPSSSATTDDLGAFRLFGLTPGDYYVAGVLRTFMMSMPGVTSTALEGYAPTYYPGTPNSAEAQRVTVKVGVESANVTFSLSATKLARISGRVVSSTGEPLVQGFVMASLMDRASFGMGMGLANAVTRGDGSFQLTGVAAGSYSLLASQRGQDANAEFGEAKITVTGDDVEGLVIVTGRGAIARGVVRADDDTPLPFRAGLISIYAQSNEPAMMTRGGGNGKVNDDWTFEVTGLSNRRRLVVSVGENPDWTLKAIVLNGQDVTDKDLDFAPGQVAEGFELVLTRKRTELSGSITDGTGKADTDATVIVFAQDAERWTGTSRFIRTARPNQDGRYTLRVVHENYFVVAVRDIEAGEWQDPEVLDTLRESAQRVSLNEGEAKVQNLRTIQR